MIKAKSFLTAWALASGLTWVGSPLFASDGVTVSCGTTAGSSVAT
jgi:hypothetical protein